MKKTIIVVLALLAPSLACISKQMAKDALTVTQGLCIAANAAVDLPILKTACGLENMADDELRALLDKFMAEQAKAGARKASSTRDAGADAHK